MVLHDDSFWRRDKNPATWKKPNIAETIKLTPVSYMCWMGHQVVSGVCSPTALSASGGLMTCVSSWRYCAHFKVVTRQNLISDVLRTWYPAGSGEVRITWPFSKSTYRMIWVFCNQLTRARARAYISACLSSSYTDYKPASELICATLNKDVI